MRPQQGQGPWSLFLFILFLEILNRDVRQGDWIKCVKNKKELYN